MRKVLAGLLTIISGVAVADTVEVGKPAPDFAAPSTAGSVAKLADYRGKWLVLYFYPKSFTSGCTKESCSLRDAYAEIQSMGAVIVGSSFDGLDKQNEFKAKYNLPFELLADTTKAVAKAYDSVMLGGLAASRKTFIIDPEGKLASIIDSVSTGDHDDQVVAELKKLQSARKP